MSADHSPVQSASTPTDTKTKDLNDFFDQLLQRRANNDSSSEIMKNKKKKAPVVAHTEMAQSGIVVAADNSKNKKNNNDTIKVVAAPAPLPPPAAATAVVAGRFTAQYGDDFTGLESWIRLCRDLGVEGPLNSKTQCKKALKHIHVNIRDFLDAIDARAAVATYYTDPVHRAFQLTLPVFVRRFDSEWSLAAYTLANHRVYPRHEIRANQEHPLRLLMAHIRYPRGAKARRGAVGC